MSALSSKIFSSYWTMFFLNLSCKSSAFASCFPRWQTWMSPEIRRSDEALSLRRHFAHPSLLPKINPFETQKSLKQKKTKTILNSYLFERKHTSYIYIYIHKPNLRPKVKTSPYHPWLAPGPQVQNWPSPQPARPAKASKPVSLLAEEGPGATKQEELHDILLHFCWFFACLS